MVKHNNVLPNAHFHKFWQRYVKTWFDQPGKKKSRRLARKAKAARIAPRPVSGPVRPVVQCPTKKYNSKTRFGKGFTFEELKEAGINRSEAKTVGISVDYRRRNKSVESLQANVQRLKAYKAKLIVFPRGSNQKPKQGDSSAEETSTATQFAGAVLPITKAAPVVEMATLTADMKSARVFYQLRAARNEQKLTGIRKRPKEEDKK